MALNKKKIIIVMCVAICFMVFGYAMFGNTLNINGSASVASNWLIEFTKIEEVSKTSGVEILNEPTASGTTATFNVNLKVPGDKIIYEVTVANNGSLDAIVNKINASETGSEAFYFNITGIKQGDKLPSGQEDIITIEIGYNASITDNPDTPKNKLIMDIEFVQDLNQSIDKEDITINGPVLTTLSGSNSLTLENSAGRNLNNYIIKGNSVQNGTPTPDAPVEIQSVGVKTKNLLDMSPIIGQTSTINGGTFIIGEDGGINVSGTPTGYVGFMFTSVISMSGKITFSMSGDFSNIGWQIDLLDANSNTLYTFNLTKGYTKTINIDDYPNYSYIRLYIKRAANNVELSGTAYLQIEEGETATAYEPYGYKIPIEVSGKNLIDVDKALNSSFTTDNNGVYTITKNDSDRFSANIPINLKAGTRYVISYELIETNSTYQYPLQIAWNDGTAGISSSSNYGTFTPTTDINSITIYQESAMPVGTYTTFKNLQIEEGSVSTKYEPFAETKTYNIFLDEPLRCINNYCDYIDFENKKVVRQVGVQKVSSTSHTWGVYSNDNRGVNNGYRAIFEDMIEISLTGTMENNYVLSNVFTSGAYVSEKVPTGIGWSEAKYVYFRFDGDNYGVTSIDTFKSFLDNNNIYVYYPLGEDYIKNNSIYLPKISTTEGTSIISVINDNGVTVPIEVKYYKMK